MKPTIWGIRTLRNISYGCLRRLITSEVRIVVGFLSLYEPILVPARFTSASRFCPLNSVYVRPSQSVAPRKCLHPMTQRPLSPVKDRVQVSVISLFASPRRLILHFPAQNWRPWSRWRPRSRIQEGEIDPEGTLSLAKGLLSLTRSYQSR